MFGAKTTKMYERCDIMSYNPFDLTAKLDYKPRLIARIKWWFKRRKYIKERAKNGWSSYDAWSFDTYLARVISGALEFLSQGHMSHPYEYTPEEWSEKLHYIAECFKQYNEDPPCPAYTAWHESVLREETKKGCVTISGGDEELYKAWFEEEKRNQENKMKKLKEGFDLLYEIYPSLWD